MALTLGAVTMHAAEAHLADQRQLLESKRGLPILGPVYPGLLKDASRLLRIAESFPDVSK